MKDQITYDEFSRMDIRIATVVAVDEIDGADRLYKLTLDVGDPEAGGLGERTIAAGIKRWYKPEELVGRQIVYLANLAPRMLRGVESQGMLLAADDDEAVILLPHHEVQSGTAIC